MGMFCYQCQETARERVVQCGVSAVKMKKWLNFRIS